MIASCNNVRTWGLNDVLKKYEASHGVNPHKERFHGMWRKGQTDFFLKRPMDIDYRDYCIRDVLDLPEVYKKMMIDMSDWEIALAKWVSSHYVTFGYQCTVNEA